MAGLSVFAFVLVVTGAVADRQQQGRVAQVGYLSVRDASSQAPEIENSVTAC
jgi:hypothetical protein